MTEPYSVSWYKEHWFTTAKTHLRKGEQLHKTEGTATDNNKGLRSKYLKTDIKNKY